MIEKLDRDGFVLDFQKINAQPIEFYDDSIGELVSQDIYQVARKDDLYKINIIKKSKNKGNEIFRITVNQKELNEILWGLPKELFYGLSETRDEFKKEMESWNSENTGSKFFITDNDALPLYSRGKLVQHDEVINSYVVGKLLPIYEEFGEEFIGEKPFTILFARPESFAYIFDNEINISVSFTELKSILHLNKLYLAAAKVFYGKKSHEFRLNYAISNLNKARSDLNLNNLSCVIFNRDLNPDFSNLDNFEIDCLKKLLKAFPSIKDELKIEIQDLIIGGNLNSYGMGITDKGIIVIKNGLQNFSIIKQKFLENSLSIGV
ncbi:MAG: hypothetical protein ACFFCM_07555 [Promethearchaeota archaeon]